MSLSDLISEPFDLLLELEQRARDAIAARKGTDQTVEEWIGVAFRLGSEQFVTGRTEVREILPAPEQLTRVPGARPWMRGIANVRGQLITVIDLRAFLGAGPVQNDRKARMLLISSREVPTAVLVDEVLGFRRFAMTDFNNRPATTAVRCEQYLSGVWRPGSDGFPMFDMQRLLADPDFLNAGGLKAG